LIDKYIFNEIIIADLLQMKMITVTKKYVHGKNNFVNKGSII